MDTLTTEFLAFKNEPTQANLLGFLNKYIPFELNNEILESLTHKSFAHEYNQDLGHNERLEFLGDSVLQLVMTETLYQRNPHEKEGVLSKLRSNLVNESTLAQVARLKQLPKFILLGKGEFKNKGYEKPSLLANAYEAYIGAIYLTSGFENAREMIMRDYQKLQEQEEVELFHPQALLNFDPKSRLQEICHQVFKQNPEYKVEALAKDKMKITCIVGEKVLGSIETNSKKNGMQKLAKDILNKEKLSC